MAGKRFAKGLAAGAFALALVLPASASAGGLADTYVDQDTGVDTNPCTLALPCETIQQGIDEVDPGGTVHVDPDTNLYAFDMTVGNGISAVADDFVGGAEGETVAVNPGGFTALNVLASGAGTISGFALSSTTTPVVNVAGAVNFTGNRVLVPALGATGIAISAAPTDVVVIDDNDFFGGSADQRAIEADGADLTVSGNRIGDAGNRFNGGVFVESTTGAEIIGNTFNGFQPHMATAGQVIYIQDATATIIANSVRDSAAAGTVLPIQIIETADATATGADLHRNELYGEDVGTGVSVSDTAGAVTLDGDLITGFSTGLSTEDAGADSPTDADVSVTGATLWENTADIGLDDSDLTLDSTIMSTGVAETGTVSCAITFSRAAADVPSASGCTDVQTIEGPGFVDPAPAIGDPDLHLTAGSAMIDAGNPATPSELLDIDGLPRLADGDQLCPEELRRDIGADEFGAQLDCDPPQTRIKGKRRSKKARVRFKLISDEPGSTFRCKLDRRPYRKCKARYRTPRLDNGRHRLKAKATDASGNQDPTAAVKRFRVVVAD